ncbi:MAG: hypothetical protein ACRCR2_02030 [Fusobacteriaceae bacterium]
MKKKIMLLILVGSLAYGKMPKDIKDKVSRDAREMYEDRKDAMSFIDWQESSYDEMEETLAVAEIPRESKEQIKFYLRGKYGLNFIKQNAELGEEINKVKNSEKNIKVAAIREVERIIAEKKIGELEAEINQKSKKELEVIEKFVEIPTNLMTRFKSEAERLYPGNYYEQKRYMESSIGNYQYYKTIK